MPAKKRKRKYWYLFVIQECPVCGRDHSYKERKYTPKPKDAQDRYQRKDAYDWCDVDIYG